MSLLSAVAQFSRMTALPGRGTPKVIKTAEHEENKLVLDPTDVVI